ncbi:hypothetical protein PVNG_05344 [Plasmodium vivax North Korean]|uniref:Uncharacterized protein n=1 Tax=Plasmodium vivax North Korean TaxID=1035514 RepID=A0A0J9WEM4_PLAVI|nr:hypothetical protein PVNG_05344 [Plasmodium vivax North Korean]
MLVNVDILTDYDVYCGTYENPYQHSHVTYVCSIILNYLKNNNVSDNNTNQFSICKLLNYWAYSKLNDLFPSKGKSEIDNFYKEIEKIWKERINDRSSADYYGKCKPDILLFDYDDWKLRKELYDYYVDILPISISPESYKQDCEQYYKYIKYKKKIYDQYEIFCKNPLDKNCPSFFEKCKKYNPNDILPMLPCYSEMVAKELEQQQASQAARGIRGYEDPSGQLSNTETTNPSTSIGANAGNVFLGVVVTSMTSGALYKRIFIFLHHYIYYYFDGIFPTCKHDFDRETKNLNGEYMDNCISISRQLHNDGENKFIKPCQKLIHYLKYIKKNLAIVDKKKNCNYFNYKLMDELKKILNISEGTVGCYNTMISAYSKDSDGIDVCKENIEEINEKTLEKFQKIDSLYDIFYKFTSTQEEGDSEKCDLGKKCSEQYYTLINICDQNSNIGFCMALDKFKDGYNAYMNNGPKCEKAPRYLYSPFGIEKRRIFFISIITIFTMSIYLYTTQKMSLNIFRKNIKHK